MAFHLGADDRDGPVFTDGKLPAAAIPALGRVRCLPEPDHRADELALPDEVGQL